MTAALILLAIIVGAGAILYVHHRLSTHKEQQEEEPGTPADNSDNGECCGMHITCERDSLLAAVSAKIEYYDDEELDRFAGRKADSYSDNETEEFRDVLLSMRPDDIAGWARSIQLRGIELPESVRDELLLIVAEERSRRTSTQTTTKGTNV